MSDRLQEAQDSLSSLKEIIEELDFLDDSEAQIEYLIDLGLELPKISEELKTEQYRVHGCQSNVWMNIEFHDKGETAKMLVIAQSDAMIVSGLIAVLMAIYNGKTALESLEIDVIKIFDRLKLDKHISPQRKNGLNGMVKRIRESANLQLVIDTHS